MKDEIQLYFDKMPTIKKALCKNASNPLENSHFVTLLESALKGLEFVGYATMDWKLLTIIELVRSWMKEKQEELKASKQTVDFNSGFRW